MLDERLQHLGKGKIGKIGDRPRFGKIGDRPRFKLGTGIDDTQVHYTGKGTTNKRWLHADERGSIITETDITGTVVETHTYGVYGQPGNESDSRFRYTGQILLPGTKLYHYKARVYHPELGRFMQTDPIGYKDGMNLYAYVGNDPVNGRDPTGTKTYECKGADSSGCGASSSELKEGDVLVGKNGTVVVGGRQENMGGGGFVNETELATLTAAATAKKIGTKALGLLTRAASVVGMALSLRSDSQQGEPVYRVYGGKSPLHGNSWTPVDPRTVPNYRDAAGLPDNNSGTSLAMGYLHNRTGVVTRDALALDGNNGGLPEYLVPNPQRQIRVMWSRPLDPPY